jgi:hypothetical protein
VGYVVSNRRVKLLSVELQVLYFLRTDRMKKLGGDCAGSSEARGSKSDFAREQAVPHNSRDHVDDFKTPFPS